MALVLVIAPLGWNSEFLVDVATGPGLPLWHLSNWLCPPVGERCCLFSERQLAHHLWGALCYVAAWWAIFIGLVVGLQRMRSMRVPLGAATPSR